METKDPGITDIARFLANRIPTGAQTQGRAVEDWRTTLYNAKSTRSERPLADMVKRILPDDQEAASLCDSLLPARRR